MSWYNNNWNCRKSHVIQHASGAEYGYQVRVHVHYGAPVNDSGDNDEDVYLNGFCQTDFGDIRFTRTDGSTELPYWMGSKEDAKEAEFWVKMPSSEENLSTTDITIYLYYNHYNGTNSPVSTTSSFDDTFIFGDPFDNATLNQNRWTNVDGNPNYTINDTEHYLEVTDMASNNWWNGKGFHSKNLLFPSSWIIEGAYGKNAMFMGYHDSATAGENFGLVFNVHHTTFNSSDRGIAHVDVIDDWTANKHWHVDAGVGGNVDWSTGEQSVSPPLSTGVRIWKLSGNIHIEVADVERVNEANSETPNVVCIGLVRSSAGGFGTERAYAFKIRKYVSPEPQHGSWGSLDIHDTIVVYNTDQITGYASKNTTITSSADPIIKVVTNFEPYDDILKSPIIENIILQGDEGDETAILLEDVYNCQIRNVTIKNCDVGINLKNTGEGKWTEATHIEHVRMIDVTTGIKFDRLDENADRSFAFTHIEDVGILLKNQANCTGIEVGPGCKPYSAFIKANIWMTQDCKGMDIKKMGQDETGDGQIKYGLVNLYVTQLGSTAGTGVDIDSNVNHAVYQNHSFFLATDNLTVGVHQVQGNYENDINAVTV